MSPKIFIFKVAGKISEPLTTISKSSMPVWQTIFEVYILGSKMLFCQPSCQGSISRRISYFRKNSRSCRITWKVYFTHYDISVPQVLFEYSACPPCFVHIYTWFVCHFLEDYRGYFPSYFYTGRPRKNGAVGFQLFLPWTN